MPSSDADASVATGGLDPQVEAVLVRLQQVLLTDGYRYSAGDVDAWPDAVVELTREGERVFVSPWRTQWTDRLVALWRKAAADGGLLLVGAHPPDSPAVDVLFGQAPGAVGYVHAASGDVRVHTPSDGQSRPPAILDPDVLRRALDPGRNPDARKIDCRERLPADLAESGRIRRFHRATHEAGGSRRPWLTWTFTAVIVSLFMAMLLTTGGRPADSQTLRAWGAMASEDVAAGQWWRLLTVALVHGNAIHILFNGLAAVYLGGLIERWQGRLRLAALFAFSVLTASTLSLALHGPSLVAVGASGGIFGLIGAMVAVVVRWRGHFPPTLWKALRQWLGTILLYNLLFLLIPNIDWAAHLGGLIGGFALTLAISRPPTQRRWLSVWQWISAAAVAAAGVGAAWWVIAHLPGA